MNKYNNFKTIFEYMLKNFILTKEQLNLVKKIKKL